MPTLRGKITSVVFRNEGSGETAARIAPEGKNPKRVSYAFIGTFVFPFTVGEVVEVEGVWGAHPRLGKALKAESVKRVPPRTREGEARFLASQVKGLSKKRAGEVLAQFGGLEELTAVCRSEPERLDEVLGRAKVLKRRLRETPWVREDLDADLQAALRSAGLRADQIRRLVRFFGAGALRRTVQASPYDLCTVPGIGVQTADRLAQFYARAQHREFAPTNPERLIYAVREAVARQRRHGHVGAPEEQVLVEAGRALGLPSSARTLAAMKDALAEALARRLVIAEYGLLYTRGGRKAEADLALRLAKLSASRARAWTGSSDDLARAIEQAGFTGEQAEALRLLATSPVALLVGGPGRGKTHTLRGLVALMKKRSRPIALLAPTGKAAARLQEATGHPASTIHRACGLIEGRESGRRPRSRKLQEALVVVDEASMLDLEVAGELLRQIRLGHTAVVFVGDPNQLPPVGVGQVLRDMLTAGVLPTARLTEVRRQAEGSALVSAADRINEGLIPEFSGSGHEVRLFDPSTAPNHTSGRPAQVVAGHEARITVRWLRQAILRYSRDLGIDPLSGIQVYAPQRSGPLGLIALNQVLQASFNPGSGPAAKISDNFMAREGDKVIQTQNNYGLSATRTGSTVAVMNGQVGRVTGVAGSGRVTVEFADIGEVSYSNASERAQLAPAYAISIHRSQGSEVDFAMVVLPCDTYTGLLCRPLVYTAWTRAKRGVAVFAAADTLARAVASVSGFERHTALAPRLREAVAAKGSRQNAAPRTEAASQPQRPPRKRRSAPTSASLALSL